MEKEKQNFAFSGFDCILIILIEKCTYVIILITEIKDIYLEFLIQKYYADPSLKNGSHDLIKPKVHANGSFLNKIQ